MTANGLDILTFRVTERVFFLVAEQVLRADFFMVDNWLSDEFELRR